jgi:hypothetical protein
MSENTTPATPRGRSVRRFRRRSVRGAHGRSDFDRSRCSHRFRRPSYGWAPWRGRSAWSSERRLPFPPPPPQGVPFLRRQGGLCRL